MTPRTEEQYKEIREDKIKAIREAALICFARKGFEGTSMAQIAKEANISKGLIYNYFDSKEAMVHEIVRDVFETVYYRFQLPESNKMTDEDFKRFMNVSLDIVIEDPQRYRLFFGLLTQQHVIKLFMDDMMARMQPMIMMFISYFTEKGHPDPIAMMRFVSAAIDGIQMHIMLDPVNFPVEKVREIMLDSFFNLINKKN